ncbi:hypothetical protein L1887_08795 [Cichorium endivia]|nr:hypothetical protein L1887_08795 [Cichorium endivia]
MSGPALMMASGHSTTSRSIVALGNGRRKSTFVRKRSDINYSNLLLIPNTIIVLSPTAQPLWLRQLEFMSTAALRS